ncbi:hypothetical protein KJ359_004781 [Pestalotiopsis sp. 9143b]|nr:hypothetical protein KJ359_004781 [Pestalotiopsis sp. 9143b]
MAGSYVSTDPFGNYVVPPPITYQPQYPPRSQPQSSALKKGETIRVTIGEVHGGQTMSQQDMLKRNSIGEEDLPTLGLDSLDLGEHRFPKEHLGFDVNNNLYQKSPRWEPKFDLQPKVTLQGGKVFDPNKYARTINIGVREFLLKDRVTANCRPDVDVSSLTDQQQFHRREILTRAWQLYCARELRARGNRGYYCIDRRNVLSLRNDKTHLIEAAIVAKWEEVPSVPGGWAFVGADQLVLPNFEPIDMLGIFEAQLSQFNGDIEDMIAIRGQAPTPPASFPDNLVKSKQEQLGVSNKVKRAYDAPRAKAKRRRAKDESDDDYVP